jgi:hypothetical protein
MQLQNKSESLLPFFLCKKQNKKQANKMTFDLTDFIWLSSLFFAYYGLDKNMMLL